MGIKILYELIVQFKPPKQINLSIWVLTDIRTEGNLEAEDLTNILSQVNSWLNCRSVILAKKSKLAEFIMRICEIPVDNLMSTFPFVMWTMFPVLKSTEVCFF